MAAALEKGMSEDKRAVLNCALCNEEIKKPKLLSCQHSFCTQCLVQRYDDLGEGMPFCCPTCQMNIEHDTVDGIPNNYLYGIIVDSFSNVCTSETKCMPCAHDKKTTNATHKCLDCGDTLCQHCNTWHCKFTVSKHHIVVAIVNLREGHFQDEFSRRKVLYCDLHSTVEHQVPLTSYCDKCSCLVCADCIQGDHNGHTFTKLHPERLKQQQRVCDENLNTFQRSQRDQDKRIGNIKKALLDTKHIWDQQETDLYNTATELYALVDKIKDEKLNEIKTFYEKELQYLDILLEEATNIQSSLHATLAFAKMFVEKSSDSDFLYYEKDIRAKMETSQKRAIQHSKRNLVIFKKHKADSVKIGLRDIFGRIETQKQFLHKGQIGQVKEKFKRTIGSGRIYGLTYSENNKEIFLVGEGDSKINIFSEDGHFRRSIPFENVPTDIHVKGGLIFVTNSQKNLRKVVIMDQKGMVQNKVRLPDDDQGTNEKLALVVGDDNCVFIASTQMHRIYKWHPEEDNMSIIISKDMGHTLSSPQYICTTPTEDLVVSNSGSPDIQVYSKEGELQWQHDYDTEGCRYIADLYGVCCDEDGYIYVIDKANDIIQVLRDKILVGNIRLYRGLKGLLPLISTPDGDLIYGSGNKLVRISFWE